MRNAMRPYVICHTMTSIDGKIDGAISAVAAKGEYEKTGIEGSHEIAALFDGIGSKGHRIAPLELKSVEQRDGGTLWIPYAVVQSEPE
jgi:hypothetical protein